MEVAFASEEVGGKTVHIEKKMTGTAHEERPKKGLHVKNQLDSNLWDSNLGGRIRSCLGGSKNQYSLKKARSP